MSCFLALALSGSRGGWARVARGGPGEAGSRAQRALVVVRHGASTRPLCARPCDAHARLERIASLTGVVGVARAMRREHTWSRGVCVWVNRRMIAEQMYSLGKM